MYSEESLTGVNGWLLLFVVLNFISPFIYVITLTPILQHTRVLATGHTAPQILFLLILISGALGIFLGLLAAIGILRTSPWALNAVAMSPSTPPKPSTPF